MKSVLPVQQCFDTFPKTAVFIINFMTFQEPVTLNLGAFTLIILPLQTATNSVSTLYGALLP